MHRTKESDSFFKHILNIVQDRKPPLFENELVKNKSVYINC